MTSPLMHGYYYPESTITIVWSAVLGWSHYRMVFATLVIRTTG
jgi:hypothetical protein